MRRRLGCTIGIVALASACDVPPTCGGRLLDACRKAQDLAYAVGIQLADESSTGNAIIGDVNAMGATGKAAVSVRVTGMPGDGARLEGVPVRTDGADNASTFSADRSTETAISIDGVVGAWHGAPLGKLRFGGVDVLGSVVLTPNTNRGNLTFAGRPAFLGMGVRLGLIEESRLVPAVSLTSMIRVAKRFSVDVPALPTDSGGFVKLKLERGDISSLEYRLATSKKFGPFGLSSGIGQNNYYITSDYVVEGSGELGSGFELASFTIARTNMFVGATYTYDKLTLGAEFGRVTGGSTPEMRTRFGAHSATAPRNYLSVGIRVPAGRTLDKR